MTPTVDFANIIHGHLAEMMSSNIDLFHQSGMAILAAFALMLIIGTGAKMALAGNGIDWTAFIALAFQIATISALLQAYTTKVGWLGNQSVVEVIGDGPRYFADKIGTNSVDNFNKTYDNWQKMHPETAGSTLESAWSILSAPIDGIVLMLLMLLLRSLLALVIAWGLIAEGVCIMIGPLFIPFLLFDKLSFLFWGWFKCFLQYAFYQLIATLVADLLCMFMIDIMTQFGVAGAAIGLIPWVLLAALSLLSVPALVSSLFSGSSSSPSLHSIASMARGR